MTNMRMYLFNTGWISLDQTGLTPGRGLGTITKVPTPVALITHPKGNVLFDTGMNPDVIDDPEGTWGLITQVPIPAIPEMEKGQDIVSQLAELDILPNDIKYVVSSHLHLDHCGSHRFFPESVHIVQKNEIRVAFYPEPFQKAVYLRKDFDHPLKYEDIEGDYDLFGDGKVVLLETPGHSQGHQSLLVDLENSGKIILTADCANEPDNMDLLIVPGFCWSAESAVRSIKKLRDIRDKKGAMVIFGHSLEQWNTLKHTPEFYD